MQPAILPNLREKATNLPRPVILLFLILAARLLPADEIHWSWDIGNTSQVVTLVDSMGDDELLGQVFMIGFSGPGADPVILRWIKDKHIGGVKIFGWNGDNLPLLTAASGAMQDAAASSGQGIPLFIATDQEGGWVRHVKGETSITPGNMSIAAGGLPYDAYRTGKLIGSELRALGINMNFAPDVDVYVNPEAHVIGPRAFSSDPVQTAVLSQAYFHGMRSQGIICTAKHFPGHGNADKDSHGSLPVINDNLATLMERDLIPYRLLIPEGLPAIMTGHLAFPEITGNTIPASLSPRLIQGVLRNDLAFKGLIITDDLRMNGALYNGEGIPQAAADALRAGNDMIMISQDSRLHQRVWDHLLQVIRQDRDFRQLLKQAVSRILTVKEEYLLPEWRVPLNPDPEQLSGAIPADEGYLFQQACRALTSVADRSLPVKENERILLAGQLRGFFTAGTSRFPGSARFEYSYDPFYFAPQGAVNGIIARAAQYDRIIFCLATPGSFEVLKAVTSRAPELKKKIAVISVLTPVYLKQLDWLEAAVAAFGMGDESFAASFAALAGDFSPSGILPLKGLKN